MVPQPMIDKAPSVAMYAGSAGALWGGWAANDLAALGGLILAALGFAANLWFKWQHLKIAREAAAKAEFALKIRSMEGEGPDR